MLPLKPSVSIALRTRSRRAADTEKRWLRTFETVPTETPAISATSLIVGGLARPTILGFGAESLSRKGLVLCACASRTFGL
jgi:hypothetical protein